MSKFGTKNIGKVGSRKAANCGEVTGGSHAILSAIGLFEARCLEVGGVSEAPAGAEDVNEAKTSARD